MAKHKKLTLSFLQELGIAINKSPELSFGTLLSYIVGGEDGDLESIYDISDQEFIKLIQEYDPERGW